MISIPRAGEEGGTEGYAGGRRAGGREKGRKRQGGWDEGTEGPEEALDLVVDVGAHRSTQMIHQMDSCKRSHGQS